MQRYDDCGEKAWLYTDNAATPTYALLGSACRDRFCPTCQAARAKVISDNLGPRINPKTHRFATLTLQSDNRPLDQRIDHLYAAFRQLRLYPGWRYHVSGGLAICEIKYSHAASSWHVHLHLILEGVYFRQEDLSALWRAASGGSYIVDIRQIHDSKHMSKYLTKYLTKPISDDLLDYPSLANDVVNGLYRRHMTMTFGKWRGLHLTTPKRKTSWYPVCCFHHLMRAADDMQEWALLIVKDLAARGPQRWSHTPGPHQPLNSTAQYGLPYTHAPPPTDNTSDPN